MELDLKVRPSSLKLIHTIHQLELQVKKYFNMLKIQELLHCYKSDHNQMKFYSQQENMQLHSQLKLKHKLRLCTSNWRFRMKEVVLLLLQFLTLHQDAQPHHTQLNHMHLMNVNKDFQDRMDNVETKMDNSMIWFQNLMLIPLLCVLNFVESINNVRDTTISSKNSPTWNGCANCGLQPTKFTLVVRIPKNACLNAASKINEHHASAY